MLHRAGILIVAVCLGASVAGCAGSPSGTPTSSPAGSPGPCRADQDFVAGVLRRIVLLQAQLVGTGAGPGAVQADFEALQREIDGLQQHQFVPQLETAKQQLVSALDQVRTALGAEASTLPSALPTALPSSPQLQSAVQSLVGAADALKQAAASCAS